MESLHLWVTLGVFAAAPCAAGILLFLSAPYGRHLRSGWGPTLPGRLGWVLMESPASIGFLTLFVLGSAASEPVPILLCALWLLHYGLRTFVYPFRLRSTKPMPVFVLALAFVYQSVNAWVNATWIGGLGAYPTDWLFDPRFIVGTGLFLTGFAINQHSDHILLTLRKPGETGYKIPRGGLYRYVSAPNYFGEIVTWVGWAIATWSLAGLSFAVFTAANLGPRAAQNHAWYRETFGEDYPHRKRLVPLLW